MRAMGSLLYNRSRRVYTRACAPASLPEAGWCPNLKQEGCGQVRLAPKGSTQWLLPPGPPPRPASLPHGLAPPPLFIFDLDGPLIDSKPDLARAVSPTRAAFRLGP